VARNDQPQNLGKPASKAALDKIAKAALEALKDQTSKLNKGALATQQIILHHVPSLIFEVLTKEKAEEYNFMI